MKAHSDNIQTKKKQPETGKTTQNQKVASQLVDNGPEAVAQRKLKEVVDNSPQTAQAAQLQAVANAVQQKPLKEKENYTGLPDKLKSGIENLSGYSMDDVKVHYYSDKPAQLQAHAYAQGTDIHLAPGQQKHLPHEAWHVVQQKQGRVKPTTQMQKDVKVNDDANLEKEADVMGNKATSFSGTDDVIQNHPSQIPASNTSIQRYKIIDLDTSQTWEEVKNAFTAIRPQLIEQGQLGREHFVMRYVEGPPTSSKLKVSEAGNLAINADNGVQHTIFFLAAGTLATANTDLLKAGSKFLLKPTGIAVVVPSQ